MQYWTQQLLNGLFAGSAYALFAVGYTLIFGVLDILNLAHQAVYMLGAFFALVLVTGQINGLTDANNQPVHLPFHLPFWLALLLGMALAGLVGIVLDRLAFAPLRRRPDTHFSAIISSIAMGLIFEALAIRFFKAEVSRFPGNTLGALAGKTLNIGGAVLPASRVLVIVATLVLVVLLTLLIRRTKFGQAIRAVAENPKAARLLGINTERIIALSFFISSALGGAAGILYSLAVSRMDPAMGHGVELKGLAVIVVGGMGSIPGAVLGGYLLGLTEVFSIATTGTSSYRDAIAFVLLFLILVVRPTGLLGARRVREA
jgi:branched-chain amino acid transport system permease protein